MIWYVVQEDYLNKQITKDKQPTLISCPCIHIVYKPFHMMNIDQYHIYIEIKNSSITLNKSINQLLLNHLPKVLFCFTYLAFISLLLDLFISFSLKMLYLFILFVEHIFPPISIIYKFWHKIMECISIIFLR